MNKKHPAIAALHQTLKERLPEVPWLPLLEACNLTGVIDSKQVKTHLGLSTRQQRQLLQVFEQACAGLPALLTELDFSIPRPGSRGRPPKVYQLGESGAALLKHAGVKKARPSGLRDPIAIAHALGMTAVHLAAQQAEVEIITDQPLTFFGDRQIRFDHRIRVDGYMLCCEIEQEAVPRRIGRLTSALSRRWDFFLSAQAQPCYDQVRLLINLPRGRAYGQTRTLWEQALGMVAVQNREAQPFDLLAMPLEEFLAQPEWTSQVSERWELLHPLNPAKRASEAVLAAQSAPHFKPQQLTADSRYLSTLAAKMPSPEDELAAYPADFLYLIADIYAPAKQRLENRNQFARKPPLSAVALLRTYLERRPELRAHLLTLLRKGKRRTWWPEQAVLQHMQRVIEAFLNYHGWYNRTFFTLTAQPGHAGQAMFPYAVEAAIYPTLQEYIRQHAPGLPLPAGEALTWVLWALFAYGNEIGLLTPAYW